MAGIQSDLQNRFLITLSEKNAKKNAGAPSQLRHFYYETKSINSICKERPY